MKDITQTLHERYWRFNPGEFLPIYDGYEMLNKKDFHRYKLRNWRQTYYQLTHQNSMVH